MPSINCEVKLILTRSENCVLTDITTQAAVPAQGTIKWNKYRSEMPKQTKNNNLNYLIDPTFTKVNRLSVLSFENEDDRISFSKYFTPSVEIKDFNALIDGKSFFDTPIKNKEEIYEAIIEMGRNSDYAAGNLLDYEYLSKHYKLITIGLSKLIELENPDLKQQFHFIGRLDKMKLQCSLSLKNQKKQLLNKIMFNLVYLWHIYKNGNSKDCKFIE